MSDSTRDCIIHFSYSFFVVVVSEKKKLATNFLDLATTFKNLGARCLLEKKVNFVPWTPKVVSSRNKFTSIYLIKKIYNLIHFVS